MHNIFDDYKDFLNICKVITDKIEDPTSATIGALSLEGDVLVIDFSVPYNTKMGHEYLYVELHFNSIDVSDSAALQFDAALEPNTRLLQIIYTDADGVGESETLETIKADNSFTKITIPFSHQRLYTTENWKKLAVIRFRLAGSGKIRLKNIRFDAVRLSENVQAIQRQQRFTFVPGHAVWMYSKSRQFIEQIREFNMRGSKKIQYIYPLACSINFKGDTPKMKFTDDIPEFYASALPDCSIMPIVESSQSLYMSNHSAATIDELARALAEKYDNLPYAYGMHFDMEPWTPDAVSFYRAIRKHSKKPVSAAFGKWNVEALAECDQAVLMGYDIAPSPKTFDETAQKLYGAFAADCNKYNIDYLIGMPFVATHVEYEYKQNINSGDRIETGWRMDDFSEAAFKVISTLPGNRNLLTGIAIWGLLEKGVGAHEAWRFYPYQISKMGWERLENFSVAGSMQPAEVGG